LTLDLSFSHGFDGHVVRLECVSNAKRLYAKSRGQFAAIERAICMNDLPSRRLGTSQRGAATMPARSRGVN
jgi:hypothetical protein